MDCRNCRWKGTACKQCQKDQEEQRQASLERITMKVVHNYFHKPYNRYGR